jgi:hypothetical protein
LVICLGQGRVEYQPFNPGASLHGFQGFSKGLVFALLSFGGFGQLQPKKLMLPVPSFRVLL